MEQFWKTMLEEKQNALPTPCRCGQINARLCSEEGLNNHWNFPPFSYLPHENDLDEDYYAEDTEVHMWKPIRHWVLIGKIVEISCFVRPRAQVESRFGESFMVHFYLEDANHPTFFKWEDLKPGRTIAIFYPYRHDFMDMTTGIRQTNADTVMVFPVSPAVLSKAFGSIHKMTNSLKNDNLFRYCIFCGTKASTESQTIKQCSRCKEVYYCSTDCQRYHWKQSHKKLCRHAHILVKLAHIDFTVFVDHYGWDLVLKDIPSKSEQIALGQQTISDFIRKVGGQPVRMSQCLETMLDAIGDIQIISDPISGTISKGFGKRFKKRFEVRVKETFIHKALSNFCAFLQNNQDSRNFVVDLKAQNDPMMELIMTTIFISIPIWQHNIGLSRLWWSIESHSYWMNGNTASKIYSDKWEVKDDSSGIDVLFVSNRMSGARAIFADNITFVADIGEEMAKSNRDRFILRILRVTGNKSYRDSIQRIVMKEQLPNCYTLWIREDVAVCGQFKPRGKAYVFTGTGFAGMNDEEEDVSSDTQRICKRCKKTLKKKGDSHCSFCAFQVVCAQCGVGKSSMEFSKNQLKKAQSKRRCKKCVK
eukprot:459961_1